jgi:hypothetical protein
LAEYRTEVYRLIAEIDTATDRDSLLVEERIKTLKALLEDTDKRIAVYVRELERSRTGEALYASLGRGSRAALTPPHPPEDSPPVEVPQAPPARPDSKRAVPVQDESVDQTPPAPAARVSPRQQIAGLAAAGLSPGEIASRLDISLAEVDLALHLLGRITSP